MKRVLSICLIAVLTLSFVGCLNPQAVVDGAIAGLNTYDGGETPGSNEQILGKKIVGELQNFNQLYTAIKSAAASAKNGLASQIAAVAQAITQDSAQLLSLDGVKNPSKVNDLKLAIASADAFIAIVQDQYPNPSGDSVQLNSTTAQLKVAVATAGAPAPGGK